jgi:glycosyltransferase involved in cell wall biosynthesis
MFAGRESHRTAEEERKALQRAQACIVVSSRDRDAFRRMDPASRVPLHVLPNCAQDRFQPGPPIRAEKGVLVVGAFGWYPNRDGLRWFAAHVLPLLRRNLPRVPIRVAGSAIKGRFARELRSQGLEVFADVADILPYLQTARLLCVPLRIGGGTRIKVVEAWAAGLPVVSTSLGAEGLPCRNGLDLLIADEASGFAAAVRRILEEEDLYHRLREQGLKRATDFRWTGLVRPLQEIYRNVLKNRMDG